MESAPQPPSPPAFLQIPADEWFKIEVSTQCWEENLPNHFKPRVLSVQYRSHGVWGTKANKPRASHRKDLHGNIASHGWRHTFMLKEHNVVEPFKQFLFSMGHFFNDHGVSGPLLTLKGITAFTSSIDLVYVSCIFECTSDAIEHAQLCDLALPPLHHEVIPNLLLDYVHFPPIPVSPNQVLRR